MNQYNIADEILDYAIENEIEAYNFYTMLQAQVNNIQMKEVFNDFAAEEQGHRKLLEDVKKGKKVKIGGDNILDLKIADYAVDIKPTSNIRYQDALVLAMKKEKASFALYTDLAAAITDPEGKKLFQSLAQQEAKHKLRFELEYDDVVLKED